MNFSPVRLKSRRQSASPARLASTPGVWQQLCGALWAAVIGGLLAAAAHRANAVAAELESRRPEPLAIAARRSHIQPVGEMRRNPANRVARVGLTLSRAPEILRRQLALHRGEGLVVDAVEPQSPAATIGIQAHDVLVRLDEQLLVLPEQLAVLLEAMPLQTPASPATAAEPRGGVLTLLRAGRPLQIALGRPAATRAARENQIHADPAPPATVGKATQASPITPAEKSAPAALQATRPQPPWSSLRQPDSAVDLAGGGSGRDTTAEDAVLLREDDDFSLRLTQGDQTRLTVMTPAGTRVFDGRIDTPERLARIPAAVRTRVDAMLKLLGPQPGGPPNRPSSGGPVSVSR